MQRSPEFAIRETLLTKVYWSTVKIRQNSTSQKIAKKINHWLKTLTSILNLNLYSLPIIAPPTAPRNLNTSFLSGILITLTWLPPINTGGRSDLRYDVSYVEGTRKITQSSTVNNIILTSLIPLTRYLISVEAVNGVS